MVASGRSVRWMTMLLLGSIWVAGCGRGGPDVVSVTGLVTLDGGPVEGAIVTFNPSDPSGVFATGITTADGRFRLNPIAAGGKPGSGAVAGEYVVTIAKVETPPAAPAANPDDPSVSEASVRKAPKPKYIVPKDYGSKETSGLTATVGSGSNDFTFELVSSFKAK
jgi:hypothetical protein